MGVRFAGDLPGPTGLGGEEGPLLHPHLVLAAAPRVGALCGWVGWLRRWTNFLIFPGKS